MGFQLHAKGLAQENSHSGPNNIVEPETKLPSWPSFVDPHHKKVSEENCDSEVKTFVGFLYYQRLPKHYEWQIEPGRKYSSPSIF